MDRDFIISLAIGIAIFAIALFLCPETTCEDGWKSGSIGRQGACSHHGGVDYNSEYIIFGLIGGFFFGRKTYKILTRKSAKQTRIETKPQIILDIEDAMIAGRKIQFLYKKPSDKSYHLRTIKPIEFKKIRHSYGGNYTLCIKGVCDLRSAERHFAISRMKELKIV